MIYHLTASTGIVLRDDGAFIPADGGNADWQAYQQWLSLGNQPTPYAPAAQVPQSVTRFQALAALSEAGLLTATKAIFADQQTTVLARLAWENAFEFKRTSPTLLQLAPLLGLDSSALDALFTRAAAIDA